MLASSSLSFSRSSSIGPHRLDVLGGRPSASSIAVVEHGPRAQRRREVQVEHRVVGVAVVRGGAAPRTPCPRAAPRGRRAEHAITRPASTVSDGPTEMPLSAQGFDELDQVARDAVRRQRLRRAGAADGHQFSLSSPAALI